MKKIILALAVLMTAQSSFAGNDCRNLYDSVMRAKTIEFTAMRDFAYDGVKQATPFTVGYTIGSAAIPAMLPAAALMAGVQGTFYLIGSAYAIALAHIPEETALDYRTLAKHGKGYVRRILIKARKVNINTTMEDVTTIITRGFENGDFCANPEKLFGPRKIRKYVLERI